MFVAFPFLYLAAFGHVEGQTTENALALDVSSEGTVLDILDSVPTLSKLASLVVQAGISDELIRPSPLKTIFSPNDDAFDGSVDDMVLQNVMGDEEWRLHLINLLLYHVVSRPINSSDIMDSPGSIIYQSLNDEVVRLEPDVEENDTGLPPVILVNGNARVTQADRRASNGIVHEIDQILQPAWYERTITDVLIVAAPNRFSTWLQIGERVGFDTLLSSKSTRPFSVFVPTDLAFSQLESGKGINLLNNLDNEFVRDTLSYHVVEGIYTGTDLLQTETLRTILGIDLRVTQGTRSIRINGANILQTNLLANNGIVHVLSDVVLLPDSDREHEQCRVHAANEELAGVHMNVTCRCDREQGTTRMKCTSSSFLGTSQEGGRLVTNACTPKYGTCKNSMECCSVPLQRCIGGQCRASSRARVQMGQNGSTDRLRGRPRSDTDVGVRPSLSLFP